MANLMQSEDEYACRCCSKHVPLPTVFYRILISGTVISLCPTTWFNVNKLLTSYRMYDSIPPGSVRKHYSKFVQDLVLEIWKEYNEGRDRS